MAGTSYKIRGIEPPDLGSYPAEVRKLYWSWVVELGIRAKGKEILAGLDKDGKPLRPILEETRKHRKSEMSPSGKGDPSAPPLIPAWQKSRTYSLLAGRALTTHAEFYWRYDSWTGKSWGDTLAYQAKQGRDVIGISPVAIAKVKVQSWAKWNAWKHGAIREVAQPALASAAVKPPRTARRSAEEANIGLTLTLPTTSTETFNGGRAVGGKSPQEWAKYFRATAAANPPGRPSNPRPRSPISGPRYNRLIAHTWNQGTRPGSSGTAAPVPPRPVPRTPPAQPANPVAANRIAATNRMPKPMAVPPAPPTTPPVNSGAPQIMVDQPSGPRLFARLKSKFKAIFKWIGWGR